MLLELLENAKSYYLAFLTK